MTILAAAGAAFVYGFVGSLHCAAMCGPLCCAFLAPRSPAPRSPAPRATVPGTCPTPGDTRGEGRPVAARRDAFSAALAYSATRVLAYGALGGAAGLVGSASGALGSRWGAILSSRTALVAFAVLLALVALPWGGLTRRLLGGWTLGARVASRLSSFLLGIPRGARGAFLGLATPLLPCGFLYGALAGAVSAGSIAGGLVIMLAFALGTVPVLVLLVVGAGTLAGAISSRSARRLQQAVAILAAAFFLRAAYAAPPSPPGAQDHPACPHCATDTVPHAGG